MVLPSPGPGLKPESMGSTPSFSLLRAHAPDLVSSLSLSLAPCTESLCRLPSALCWTQPLPDVISTNLSLDAWTHTPVVPLVRLLVSSQRTTALTDMGAARHSTNTPTIQLLWRCAFRGCNHSLMFRLPGLLATQVVPTATALVCQAAVAFTSTHISVCCLPEQWIC